MSAIDAGSVRKFVVTGSMATDAGLVRTSNEDVVAYVVPSPQEPGRDFLALVADGMGGHAAGEVASAMVADTVRGAYFAHGGEPPAALAEAIETANQRIRAYAEANPECAGMGSTCTVLVFRAGKMFLGHVGDSRAYIMRDEDFHQITEDHTLRARMVRDGLLSADEAEQQVSGNVIWQALGTSESIEPTIWSEGLPVRAKDIFLLCSDGLSDLVPDDAIAAALREQRSEGIAPTRTCAALVRAALEAGGHDNVSVGVFVVENADEEASNRTQRKTRPIVLSPRIAEDGPYARNLAGSRA